MARVLSIGEVMVEMTLGDRREATLGYAGDSFNTAVYLSRLGVQTQYASALGADDPFSAGVLAMMARENVDAELMARLKGQLPGLYAIQRGPEGERRFFYWRGEAAVRQFPTPEDLAKLRAAALTADLVYLTGVTLAVIGEQGRQVLAETIDGCRLGMDANYRASLWPDPADARAVLEPWIPHCGYVSASAEDLGALGLAQAPQQWAEGGAEVVERCKDRSIRILRPGQPPLELAPNPYVPALDTTGAGDSFNAAYLAARLRGEPPEAAVEAGRRLAAVVIQHVGAIIRRSAMPR